MAAASSGKSTYPTWFPARSVSSRDDTHPLCEKSCVKSASVIRGRFVMNSVETPEPESDDAIAREKLAVRRRTRARATAEVTGRSLDRPASPRANCKFHNLVGVARANFNFDEWLLTFFSSGRETPADFIDGVPSAVSFTSSYASPPPSALSISLPPLNPPASPHVETPRDPSPRIRAGDPDLPGAFATKYSTSRRAWTPAPLATAEEGTSRDTRNTARRRMEFALEGEIDDPLRGVVAVQPDVGGTIAQRGAHRVRVRRSGTARIVPAVARGDGVPGAAIIPAGDSVVFPAAGDSVVVPAAGDVFRFRLRVFADGQRAKRSGDSSRAVFGVVRARISDSNRSRRHPRAIHRDARGEGGVHTLRRGRPQIRRPQHAPVRGPSRAFHRRVVVVFSAVVRRGRGCVVVALQGRGAMVPSAAEFLGELLEAERRGVDDDASRIVESSRARRRLAATAADVQHGAPAQVSAPKVSMRNDGGGRTCPLAHAMVARAPRLLGRSVAAARARRSSVGGMREPATLAVRARPRAAPMATHPLQTHPQPPRRT